MTDEELRRARVNVEFDLDFSCSCDNEDGSHDDDCEGSGLEDAWNAMRADHDRTRASETEKTAEIERLKAERDAINAEVARVSREHQDVIDGLRADLARLTPSGQVAEDETRLRHTLNARGAAPQTHDALSRLAAKAQRMEEYAEKAQNNERLRIVAEAERDAAVADNAALMEAGDRIHGLASHDEACKMLVGDDYAMCNCAMGDWQQLQRDAANGRNPGAAVLKERQELEGAVKALVDAVALSGDWSEGDWHSSGCAGWGVPAGPCGDFCAQRRSALRLAGALP